MLSTSLHFSSLSIFTLAYFISSTTFTTSLFFILDCLTFLSRFVPSMIISTTSIFLTFSHSGFTNISFSLSFSTPISQSGLLLRLSTLSILLLGTCFNVKSNLDRYNAYFAYLQFNFYAFINIQDSCDLSRSWI